MRTFVGGQEAVTGAEFTELALGLFNPVLEGAACASPGIDPDLFFPDVDDRKGIHQAKAFCFSCPVRRDCLASALGRDERFGIFGGKTADERAAQLRSDEHQEEVTAA